MTVDGITNTNDLDAFGGSISLFPNPTKSNTTLLFGKQMSSVDIIITDVMGRIVNTYYLENVKKTTIDIEGSAGIYFIQVINDSNHSAAFKILKE